MASVSPAPIPKETPLTAFTAPSPVRKATRRSSTSRSGPPAALWVMSAVLRVDGVAQAVAHEVEREEQHDEEAEREPQLPSLPFPAQDLVGALADEEAQRGV